MPERAASPSDPLEIVRKAVREEIFSFDSSASSSSSLEQEQVLGGAVDLVDLVDLVEGEHTTAPRLIACALKEAGVASSNCWGAPPASTTS